VRPYLKKILKREKREKERMYMRMKGVVRAYTHPWEIQMEVLGVACPLEEVQDEAFQVVVGVVAALQSLEVQHVGVLSHEGHGGPAASETSL
jgi:hypothetical protein